MTPISESSPRLDTLVETVRARRTAKRFATPGDAALPTHLTEPQRAELNRIIGAAGEAPFHKRAHESHLGGPLTSPAPFRLHVLEREGCESLLGWLERRATDGDDEAIVKAWRSKIPAMLAAAGALVIVTWLPDPGATGDGPPELSMNNVEHIAAASAATQNLLLLAAAAGWYSYWSSGGVLRSATLFDVLGIATSEWPLGALFLAPPGFPADKTVPGGLRDARGTAGDWARRIDL